MIINMEQIWYNDLKGFIHPDVLANIWPSREMSFASQLNCLLRFSIYFSIIVFIIKKDINIMFVPIITGVFTYFIYNVDKESKKHKTDIYENMNVTEDTRTGRLCQKPTKHNPYMNVLISYYASNPTRKPACTLTPRVKKDIQKKSDSKLYRDVDDIFQKNASDRQFYTTPITTIPNDQTAFATWLYKSGPTCKEGDGDVCYKNVSFSFTR